MCGIFGISLEDKSRTREVDLRHDLTLLYRLSEERGRDATGMAVHAGTIQVVRRGGRAQGLLDSADYRQALGAAWRAPTRGLTVMGHCRLVTNGSVAIEDNNQPVVTDRVVGIHNGIVTNAPLSGESSMDASDTHWMFQRLSGHVAAGTSWPQACERLFSEIEGSASFAALGTSQGELVLATNTGSLFYLETAGVFVFASERVFLERFLKEAHIVASGEVYQLAVGAVKVVEVHRPVEMIQIKKHRVSTLKRCTRCILPHTYPFIRFDANGVCNFCNRHQRQVPLGETALVRLLDAHRSRDGRPDCLVGLSGGRDSSYGLHILKKKYGMNPIAYTFDWGLTTEASRRNQAKLCGKLGVEHIIRAPDIARKRAHVRENVHAFLKRPHLGMVPLFMAGDKEFYQYGRTLRRENRLPLTVFCAGHTLEQRDFMTGFCGLDENISGNKRLYQFSALGKVRLAGFYGLQYLLNPAYLNVSLWDSVRSFVYSFINRDDFLYLFQYLPWDERQIESLLATEYGWESDRSYGQNQWRMGDGQTAFTNYIYYTVAGFSEFDNFRSNQVREGMLGREEALRLAEQDNVPKWETLRYFAQVIGLNLDEVLREVNNIPKLY
jgi:hypothetical protein